MGTCPVLVTTIAIDVPAASTGIVTAIPDGAKALLIKIELPLEGATGVIVSAREPAAKVAV